MKPTVIQRFEHDRLKIGEEGFTEAHFARLVAFNDKHDSEFFTVGYRQVKFTSYVGVLRVGNLTIEILPKLDRERRDKGEEARKPLLQRLLVRMLHRVGKLPMKNADSASLKRLSGSLFDLYLELFLQEVRGIVSRGIPKRYSRESGNESFLRGRLLVPQQLTYNLIHKERFFTDHQRYSIDHPFNRILKKALSIVAGLPSLLADDAKVLLTFFETVETCEIRPDDFARLKYTRNTECYREAMGIAELIIMNYQPDVQFGCFPIVAMLFDMNRLFEAYVAHELAYAARKEGKGSVVRTQCSKSFWRTDGGRTGKTIRPDVHVRLSDGRVVVLDTKWKVLNGWLADDGDLKQLYAYSLQFSAETVYLVYPSTLDELEESSGYFEPSGGHGRRPLVQWKVPLMVGGKPNAELGRMMLDKLSAAEAAILD